MAGIRVPCIGWVHGVNVVSWCPLYLWPHTSSAGTATPDVEHGKASKESGGLAVEPGRTQGFCEDDRREDRLLERSA